MALPAMDGVQPAQSLTPKGEPNLRGAGSGDVIDSEVRGAVERQQIAGLVRTGEAPAFPCDGRPDRAAEEFRGVAMTAPMDSELIGRWLIFEADLWDQDFLDLVEPAYIRFGRDGDGEFGFGAVEGQMDLRYGHRVAKFTWAGFDEGDEVSGAGTARLEDDGTLVIELSFHLGDDAVLKARRE